MYVSKALEVPSLKDYLKTLPLEIIQEIYSHPASCLHVFRELSMLAQVYVIRLLFFEQPLSAALIESWPSCTKIENHKIIIQELCNLHIWQYVTMTGGLPGWLLNEIFRNNIKTSLFGGIEFWNLKCPAEPDPYAKDLIFLNNYAQERWECILHYMVGSSVLDGISVDTVAVLLHAGLMKSNSKEDSAPKITEKGFQFVMMVTASQLWYFLMKYLESKDKKILAECLTFLFQLSLCKLGQNYSTEGLSSILQTFLQHLREFGLIYQRKRSSGRFYPTVLINNLTCSTHSMDTENKKNGYLIVETNYRIYAYNPSSLQLALLNLFCELLYRFPNMSVAVLTRDSVQNAFRNGITANQIINFLQQQIHPICFKSGNIIPPTVSDQIKLWQLEKERFIFQEGVLYNQFLSQADFELLCSYSKDAGCLIWSNTQKRTMIVTKTGHENVKKFWKKHSKSNF